MLRIKFCITLITFSTLAVYSMEHSVGARNLPQLVEQINEWDTTSSGDEEPYSYHPPRRERQEIPPTPKLLTLDSPVPRELPHSTDTTEKELNQWVIRELIQQNNEMYKKLKSTRKKWYVGAAGFITSIIPLVVLSAELYGKANCEE